jgi:hypothetical protein
LIFSKPIWDWCRTWWKEELCREEMRVNQPVPLRNVQNQAIVNPTMITVVAQATKL